MQGMGGGTASGNPIIVAAFHAALRHQGLLVLVLVAIAAMAWTWTYTMPTRQTTTLADSIDFEPRLAEHAARKCLRIGFGVLWILDGLLQVQQAMPVGLPREVVQPAAASSPAWVQHVVNDGTSIWSRHPIPAAAAAVWIQVGIGVLLLVARRGLLSQLAGLVSVGWGVVVWVFGEAFGGIFGSGLSWMFGAPGAVLLYCAAGALIALPEQAWLGPRLGRSILTVLGAFFIAMAVLQAWPGRGFWQGQADPHATAGSLTSMVQTMAETPQPHALSSALASFGSFDAQHGWAVNLAVVISLGCLGIALLTGRSRVTLAATVFGTVLCLADWVFVQDLGFLGGVGTDPNSMIPTALLLAVGYFAFTRRSKAEPAPVPAVVPVPSPAVATDGPRDGSRRLDPVTSRVTLEVIAAAAVFGIVLVGAVPMAVASVNPHADSIVTEAINGQPQHTNSPAPTFNLTDQHGANVNLATLRGRTIALTFLDPVCTSDCPLIAQQLRRVDEGFGAAATTTTAFVAIDANPTYRDPQFLQAFDAQEQLDTTPNWYFLTGSLAQLAAVWSAYGVHVQTVGSGGMAAHTDTTYVIDGAGRLRTILGADPGGTATDSASFGALLNKEMRAVATT